jgi:outer membrane protein assembly factor BamE (lipoprotein component of BamABCDE complex)
MRYLILVVTMALTGCFSHGNASLKNDAAVEQIKIGESTKADVLRLLGKPSSTYTSEVSPGVRIELWSYTHMQAESSPLLFVPIVGLFAAASGNAVDVNVRVFSVSFSPDGVVRSITRSSSSNREQPPPESILDKGKEK